MKGSGLTSIHVIVVLVVDMGSSKAQERSTAADVIPVVVRVRYVQSSSVLSGVVVRVTNKRALGVVMEIGMRDRDPVSSVGKISEAIVEILVHVSSGSRQVAVVDPHILGQLDSDRVSIVSLDLADLHVPDNDVLLSEDGKANAFQRCKTCG